MTINIKTSTNADKTARKVKKLDKSIGGLSLRSGAAAVAVGNLVSQGFQKLGAAIVNTIKNTLAFADQLDKMSRTVGISTESLQRLQFVASQGGVETESFNKAMLRLTQGIGQAGDGLATYLRVFDRFGIAVREENGDLRDTESVLYDLADAYNDATDKAQAKADIIQLLGARGAKLIPIFEGGSESIKTLGASLDNVITQENIDNIVAYNDSVDRLGKLVTAVTANALGPFLEKLLDIADARPFEAIQEDLDPIADRLKFLKRSLEQIESGQSRGFGQERVESIKAEIKQLDQIKSIYKDIVNNRDVTLGQVQEAILGANKLNVSEKTRGILLELLSKANDKIIKQERIKAAAAAERVENAQRELDLLTGKLLPADKARLDLIDLITAHLKQTNNYSKETLASTLAQVDAYNKIDKKKKKSVEYSEYEDEILRGQNTKNAENLNLYNQLVEAKEKSLENSEYEDEILRKQNTTAADSLSNYKKLVAAKEKAAKDAEDAVRAQEKATEALLDNFKDIGRTIGREVVGALDDGKITLEDLSAISKRFLESIIINTIEVLVQKGLELAVEKLITGEKEKQNDLALNYNGTLGKGIDLLNKSSGLFNSIGTKLGTIDYGGIINKGIGIFDALGGFLGFNQGGVVPGVGNRDTVPALLTPGETVIPKGGSAGGTYNFTFDITGDVSEITRNEILGSIDEITNLVNSKNLQQGT